MDRPKAIHRGSIGCAAGAIQLEEVSNMASVKIGQVSHYYDKIGVAVVELTDTLSTGDTIRFVRGGEDLFEQTVESIQIEHEKVEKANKGQTVGLKVAEAVKAGAEVYREE